MVLVTGGSGLVGKELIAQLLSRGEAVTAVYNKTPLPDFNSSLLKKIHCDILDIATLEETMQGIEQVYHCAALITFNRKRKKELYKVNVEGTANIVNTALDAGIKKLVHVSSVSALGRLRGNETINETMKWTEETNNSNYGESKYLGEMEVWRGIGEGLNAIIVNPVIVLGNGDWNSGSTKIFKNLYEEFPWYSEGINGFVDARDVAKAMIQLMQSDINEERFILSAVNKSYREIFNLISKEFNKKPTYKKVNALLANIICKKEALKSLFKNDEPLATKETAAAALAKGPQKGKK